MTAPARSATRRIPTHFQRDVRWNRARHTVASGL